jgi:hypothetical protein
VRLDRDYTSGIIPAIHKTGLKQLGEEYTTNEAQPIFQYSSA